MPIHGDIRSSFLFFFFLFFFFFILLSLLPKLSYTKGVCVCMNIRITEGQPRDGKLSSSFAADVHLGNY